LTPDVDLNRRLNVFDVTNLVVGSIIGADIYVAAALGAKLVGPFSLVIWALAGVMAMVIALCFSYAATILPRVGGPYSYLREVAGPFNGFMVGWSLFLAEWFSLAVFPVAFTRYFTALVPGLLAYQTPMKGVFIVIVLVTNLFGVKAAGKFNDLLTMGKLAPLILLMVTGLAFVALRPQDTFPRFTPLVTGGLDKMGQALILIFWAYEGFELSTLPADEIESPERTIPRAIVMGMFIVIVFYMITNFVIVGVVNQADLATASAPLMVAASTIFNAMPALSALGKLTIGLGAIVSVLGADESGTIGTSRLAYALSIDGLFPRFFSRLHEEYGTPQVGLVVICGTAFAASVMGTLTELINASVFLLSFAYASTCLSTLLLQRKYPERSRSMRGRRVIPYLGILFSLVLMIQVKMNQILVSLLLLGAGVFVYGFFSPRRELTELRQAFMSREAILRRAYNQGDRFLAHLLRHVKWLYYRLTGRERAWKLSDQPGN
jgi:APA family basic amino acid/polyamine antiporter